MNILKEYLIEARPHRIRVPGCMQYIYKFPNGYGASVIEGTMFYTNDTHPYELAVTQFIEGTNDYNITYETPITGDVIGCLDGVELLITLEKIRELSHA